MNLEDDIKRVLWGCRRGLLELDLLLEPFVRSNYGQMCDVERKELRELLGVEDSLLYCWLLGSEKPPSQFQSLVSRVRKFHSVDRECFFR